MEKLTVEGPSKMSYDENLLMELILNDDFVSWVLHSDPQDEIQWKLFIETNPEARKAIELAREHVLEIFNYTGRKIPTDCQSNKMRSIVEKYLSSNK